MLNEQMPKNLLLGEVASGGKTKRTTQPPVQGHLLARPEGISVGSDQLTSRLQLQVEPGGDDQLDQEVARRKKG